MTLDELNQQIQSGQLDPRTGEAPKTGDGGNFWSNLATGGYNALNQVGLGLPDFLLGVGDKVAQGLGSKVSAKDFINKAREENPTGAVIGDVAGTLGSLAIPGGAITKGAGALAKGVGLTKVGEGLTKAGQFLGETGATGNLGQKILQYAGRGAGQAAEQAIPRVALGNEDINSLPLSIGAGALGNLALGPLANKLLNGRGTKQLNEFGGYLNKTINSAPTSTGKNVPEFMAEQFKDRTSKNYLESLGVTTRAIAGAARGVGIKGAAAGREGEEYMNRAAEIAARLGLDTERDVKAAIEKNPILWNAIDTEGAKNATKAGIDVNAELSKGIMASPEVLGAVGKSKAGQQALAEILETVSDKSSDFGKIRSDLGEMIRDGLHATNKDDRVMARVAYAAKQHFDDYLGKLSGQDVTAAKELNFVLQPLEWGLGKEAFKMGKPFVPGSPSEEKLGVKEAISNAIKGGAGAGGLSVGADVAQGNEIDPGRALLATAGGSIAGPLVAKSLAGILNRTFQTGARKVSQFATKNEAKIAKKISQGVENAPKAGAQLAGITGGQALESALSSKDPDKQELATASLEQNLQPGAKQQARAEFSDQFKGIIHTQLEKLYNQGYRNMDPNEFMQWAASNTDNFTNITKLAPLIYPDEEKRANFLKQYNSYLALKNVNIDRAIRGQTGLESIIPGGPNKDAGEARKILKETILNMQPDLKKRAEVERNFDKFVGQVNADKSLLPQFAQQFGLDFNELRQLGLAG